MFSDTASKKTNQLLKQGVELLHFHRITGVIRTNEHQR